MYELLFRGKVCTNSKQRVDKRLICKRIRENVEFMDK